MKIVLSKVIRLTKLTKYYSCFNSDWYIFFCIQLVKKKIIMLPTEYI